MRDLENGMPNQQHPGAEGPADVGRPDGQKQRGGHTGKALTAAAIAVVVAMIAIGVVRISSVGRTIPVDTPGDDQTPSLTPSPVAISPPHIGPIIPSGWSRVWLEPPPASGSVLAITAGGPGLVAVGYDKLAAAWTSSNGLEWNRVPGKELGPGEILDVTAGGLGLVAVGTEYNEVAPATGAQLRHSAVWTSADGFVWSRAPDAPVLQEGLMEAVTAGGPGLVAVGLWDRAWFSSDGVTWHGASVPQVGRTEVSMTDVAVAGDRLVATGWAPLGSDSQEVVIWTSTDGMTWTDVPLDANTFPPGSRVSSIVGRHTIGGDGFVSVGSAGPQSLGDVAVWNSSDGLQWRRVAFPGGTFHSDHPDADGTYAYLTGVAKGPDGYVAVGGDGQCKRGKDCPSAEAAIWASVDGESWAQVPTWPVFQAGDRSGAGAWLVTAWESGFVAVGGYRDGTAAWISEPSKRGFEAPVQASASCTSHQLHQPAKGTFADVKGWIAYRCGSRIVAVDPANPQDTLWVGRSLGTDPIGWSRDGSRLLLRPEQEEVPFWEDGLWWHGAAETGSPPDLFVLNANGPRTRLTDEGNNAWGSFSPDGSKVAYGTPGLGPSVINAHGGKPRLLVGQEKLGGIYSPCDVFPAWSPDGSRIAFIDVSGECTDSLRLVNPDGTGLRRLVKLSGAPGGGLVWSPDGSRLAFWMKGKGGLAQIYVINADGSGLRRITSEGDNRWPTWSPDGTRIAFVRGQQVFITAPDGSRGAFVSGRQLFTMAADGTDMRRVKGVWPDGAIAWNPAV